MWNIFKVNNKDTRRILTCEDVILVSGGGGFVNFEPFPSAAAGKCLPGSFEIKGNTFVKRVKACFNLNLLGLVPKFWLLVQKISEHSKQNLRQNPNLVKRRLHWRIHLLELSEQLLCRRPLNSERSIDKAIFMRLIKQFLCDWWFLHGRMRKQRTLKSLAIQVKFSLVQKSRVFRVYFYITWKLLIHL